MNLTRRPVVIALTLVAARAAALARGGEPTLAEEAAFQAAVRRVTAAVVRIEPAAGTAGPAGAEASPGAGPSTGLIVDPAGWIVTTEFAVPPDADSAIVALPDGRRLVGRATGRDAARGLVLLRTGPLPDAAPLVPAPRADLEPGQWTIAVGRAWTVAEPSVAVGILSATDRGWGRAVQTDAAVSPMNYGGPLVDIAGRVIGVLAPLPADTAGLPLGTELYDSGIGFAIPLEDVVRVLPRLQAGTRLAAGILGITYRSDDVMTGAPVLASVRPGGPAAAAGLRPGDRIIAVDGARVTRIAEVRQRVMPRYAGDTLDLRIERGMPAREIDVRATLVDVLPAWRRAVIGVQAAARAEQADGAPLPISWVLPDGPAARAGLGAGDALMAIAAGDGEPVPATSAAAVAGVLAGVEPGATVRLSWQRDGRRTDADCTTVAAPADVPESGAPAAAAGPVVPAVDAAELVRLAAAEVADPPLAVLPRSAAGPLAALVWLGPPHGRVTDAEATAWKAAAVRHGVAVIIPGSTDVRQWSRDDVAGIRRALVSLQARRPLDGARLGVAGSGAGAAFAWLLAERLGPAIRGVALVDAPLPRQATIAPAEPGSARWLLMGPGRDESAARIAADRRRLEAAGHPVGSLPAAAADAPPVEELCRWVSVLGLL